MSSNRRSSCRVRQWSASAGLAAAAVAVIGMGTAHADDGSVPTDIGLLNTAQTDIAEAFALSGHANADANFFPELEAIQTPLLSSDNSLVSGFGEALFNGPDQNLAQAGEAFLSAAQALSSATPGIGELGVLGDYASTGFQVTDAIFGELPSTFIGKLTDQIFDIGGFDTATASAATDLASPAAADPATLLSEATTNLTDANQFLGEIPSGEFASVSSAIFNQGVDIQDIASLGISENALSSFDNGVLADFLNPLFTSVNQGWDQASEAALTADQALETAVAGGSATDITSALTGLIEPSYQAIGPDFASNLIDLGAHFLTGADPFTVGIDSVSAVDPGIVADVLSSIGF